MDINQIQQKVENCLNNKNDMNAKAKMDEAISDYLKDKKCTDEIVNVIIKAMIIDRGSNFYDFLSELTEKDLQDVMKVLKNNKLIKDEGNINGLRMLVGMLYLSVINEGNIGSIRGNIIDLIVNMICSTKKSISDTVYGPIFDDYFIKEFDGSANLPDWKDTKAKEENIVAFCDILSKVVGDKNDSTIFSIKKWINDGDRYASEAIEVKRLESQIPKSKVDDLISIAEHYKDVEKKFREKVYEADRLQKQIAALEAEIVGLNQDKAKLESKIKDLHGDVADIQKNLDQAEKEVDERAALNNAFDALKKNDETALLKDIANDLKAEYGDFAASENDKMDETLGEIYREKIRNIFRILEKKGIKVE